MQHHSPDINEQPSPFAVLTVLVVPLPRADPADGELPTLSAHLRISEMPLLPPDDVQGAVPAAETEPVA
jgi:hypothetical protein